MKGKHNIQTRPTSDLRRLRKRVARLEREKAHFRRMAASDPYFNLPDMCASVDAVTKRILHCNDALCTKLGYAEHELVGGEISNIYHPNCLEDAKSTFTSLVSNGEIRDVYLVLRKKDGDAVDANLSALLFRDERKKPLFCRFIWRDITKQIKAERNLRISEQRFHQLADTIREVFWLMSIEGDEFFYLSPGYDKIWGRSRYDLIKDPFSWAESIHPDDIDEVFANFERQKRGEFVEYEFRMIRPDDEIRWIQARAFPVEDENGNPYRVAGFALDITERKRAEEQAAMQQRQLMQAARMSSIGYLTAGVAHEVNNPNNFILLNAETLEKAWFSVMPALDRYYEENGDFICAGVPYINLKSEITDMTEGIINGAKRIQEIVNELGNFLQHSDEDLNQPVDCNTVMDSAFVIVRNLIENSTNSFSQKLDRKIPKVLGNAQQLEQVFINLITNACQALPDPSRNIVVSTRKSGRHVLIEVRDEGIGIPSKNLNRIMQAFFTTKRPAGGTGLGLSISYTIVKNHDGELTFTSELGKGTTASVKLPVAP